MKELDPVITKIVEATKDYPCDEEVVDVMIAASVNVYEDLQEVFGSFIDIEFTEGGLYKKLKAKPPFGYIADICRPYNGVDPREELKAIFSEHISLEFQMDMLQRLIRACEDDMITVAPEAFTSTIEQSCASVVFIPPELNDEIEHLVETRVVPLFWRNVALCVKEGEVGKLKLNMIAACQPIPEDASEDFCYRRCTTSRFEFEITNPELCSLIVLKKEEEE